MTGEPSPANARTNVRSRHRLPARGAIRSMYRTVIRSDGSVPPMSDSGDALATTRDRIDQVDLAIVSLISRRVDLAMTAGTQKRGSGRAAVDPGREVAVVRGAASAARALGLDEEVVRGVFWQLIRLSRTAQTAEAGL